MAAPYDFNNIQPGTVLERNGHMEGVFTIPYWIVHTILRDNDNNITEIHLRMYDTNNQTASSIGIGKTLAQLQNQFTFYRQDSPLQGGKRRRSRRTKRRRRTRRVKRSRKSRRY